MEKDFETVLLLDIYAELLTPKQRRLCDMYYNQDYSLAEIAGIENTTRQAARDGIGKAKAKLKYFEDCLKLQSKKTRTMKAMGSAEDEQQLKSAIADIWEIDNGI